MIPDRFEKPHIDNSGSSESYLFRCPLETSNGWAAIRLHITPGELRAAENGTGDLIMPQGTQYLSNSI